MYGVNYFTYIKPIERPQPSPTEQGHSVISPGKLKSMITEKESKVVENVINHVNSTAESLVLASACSTVDTTKILEIQVPPSIFVGGYYPELQNKILYALTKAGWKSSKIHIVLNSGSVVRCTILLCE